MNVGKGIERIETYRVRVKGVVQGVGFRIAAVRRAHALGIKGWVRNLDDGSVEALVQGPVDQIDLMLEWLRRGPIHARVTDYTMQEDFTDKRFERFEQR